MCYAYNIDKKRNGMSMCRFTNTFCSIKFTKFTPKKYFQTLPNIAGIAMQIVALTSCEHISVCPPFK